MKYLIYLFLLMFSFGFSSAAIIADHNAAIAFHNGEVPEEWLIAAKTNIGLAYEHTSHGSQIPDGMNNLDEFMGATGFYDYDGGRRDWPEGGFFWNEFMSYFDGSTSPRYDLSTQEETWDIETRRFLDEPDNYDVNVIMWSWCQILGHNVDNGPDGYLQEMEALIAEYGPGGTNPRAAEHPVTFVFMTGHVNGDGGESGPTFEANQAIRNHVIANDRILFDFADIEKYDLEGNYFGDLNPADSCAYTGGNWCLEYQNSHIGMTSTSDEAHNYLNGGEWYTCGSAHSYPVNANQKAYAMWWLMAKLAGWEENVTQDANIVYNQSFETGDLHSWKDDFRNGGWDKGDSDPENDAVAKVNNRAYNGEWSIRGNLKPEYLDPITGKTGTSYQFEWAPSVMSSQTDDVFVSYKFRVDNTTWNGWYDSNYGDGCSEAEGGRLLDHFAGKLNYITGFDGGTGSFFMGMGAETFKQNGAYTEWINSLPYPWGVYYWWGGAAGLNAENPGWYLHTDGVWHEWEIYLNYEYNYARVWIDGEPFTDELNIATQNGILPVPEDFQMRGLQFFYTYGCFHDDSVSEQTGEYTDGWQIDDIEVWDGLPTKYSAYETVCGDGMCDATENTQNCELDCPYCENIDGDYFSATDDERCGLLDCNDNNPDINPSVSEVCNGVDDNCDGEIDEGCESSAELLVFEDFEDNDWSDSFDSTWNPANVFISDNYSIDGLAGAMFGGYLGASFNFNVDVQNHETYYIRYYTYYPDGWSWDQLSETGMKNFRAMPPDGWPLMTIKRCNDESFCTHTYYSENWTFDNGGIEQWRTIGEWPSLNNWHLQEFYFSYDDTYGGYSWYLDGELIAGIPFNEFNVNNWPPGRPLPYIDNFRIAGGNGFPNNDTFYVDNIEIWKGFPSSTGETCGNNICIASEVGVCEEDCGSLSSICPNNICENDEDTFSCPFDCSSSFIDLISVASEFGLSDGFTPEYDLNNDQIINILDLLLLINNFD